MAVMTSATRFLLDRQVCLPHPLQTESQGVAHTRRAGAGGSGGGGGACGGGGGRAAAWAAILEAETSCAGVIADCLASSSAGAGALSGSGRGAPSGSGR